MLIMVHGFFGKHAQPCGNDDIVELTVEKKCIEVIFTLYTQLYIKENKSTQLCYDELYQKITQIQCVMEHTELALLRRATIKLANKSQLQSDARLQRKLMLLLSLIATAQRYKRDIYWL
ncbi:MAG: hypothetical protein COB83_12715 [Gammaproteobacteria bacterium]|nr:MAG: hypothetical protein COB83_12715 [Gammaproteobacteria bacterium]